MEGIFLAYGPEFNPNLQPIDGLKIEDIAPTLLYTLGLSVPDDMDGRVIKEIFPSSRFTDIPLMYCPPMEKWPNKDQAIFIIDEISLETEMQIEERLRGLGYL